MVKKFFLLFLNICLLFLLSCNDNNIFLQSGSNLSETYEKEMCLIEIKGAVKYPGLYEIEVGRPLHELILMAGGFLEDANTLNVDQTLILSSNQSIYIESNNKNIIIETSKININTANVDELCTLSGVGEAKALNIIDYRNSHGRFSKIEDIMNVTGIGIALFEKIKDSICV